MEYSQERTWEVPGALLCTQWLRSAMASLGARFGPWNSYDDDDPLEIADPQMVAALRLIATLLPNGEEDRC